MQATQTNSRPALRRSISRELALTLQPAKDAAASLKKHGGRFEIYDLLEAIYRIYTDWKRRNIAKRSARTLADELSIVRRNSTSPIRILIEAALPSADFKQKSRWVRALEYIYSESVPPSQFRRFVRARGGIAGCANLAVDVNRKRRRPGGDWND
jgi:hypothetical protein